MLSRHFLTHGLTQKRWRECDGPPRRWLKHFLLVTGYATMLVLILVVLRWFQTDGWNWTSLLGYYATAVLLFVTGDAMIGRLKKREEIHRHTHSTVAARSPQRTLCEWSCSWAANHAAREWNVRT